MGDKKWWIYQDLCVIAGEVLDWLMRVKHEDLKRYWGRKGVEWLRGFVVGLYSSGSGEVYVAGLLGCMHGLLLTRIFIATTSWFLKRQTRSSGW